MGREAVIIENGHSGGIGFRRTCADATGIEKGALLILSGANEVFNSNGSAHSKAFGGIASTEKVASDGSTTIGAIMDGSWDLFVINTGVTGQAVVLSGANFVRAVAEGDINACTMSSALVGYLEEPASSASGAYRVRLRGY